MKSRIQRMIIGIAVLPLALIALLFIYIVLSRIAFSVLGYPIDIAPDVLATKIVREKLKPDLCNKLRQSLPSMGPSVVEKRQMCIAGVAALAKDPSACELLMPSSYGLSCVGGAKESDLCSFVNEDVWWIENGIDKKMPRSNCKRESTSWSVEAHACCTVSKVSSIRLENDCSSLKSNIPYYDECLYRMAFKNHDPSSCSDITNQNRKIACTVSAKALQQDPSICTGCTPLLETLEDIK